MIRTLTSLLFLLGALGGFSGCECGQGSFFLFGMGGDKDNATLCNVTYADGIETSTEHRIFVTSTTYNGNLGGLSGADAICQTLASNAGLSLTYKAVLSDSTANAKDRLTFRGTIYLFDSSRKRWIVSQDGNLFNGLYLEHSINIFETGSKMDESISNPVWSGTTSSGVASTKHCQNWASTSGIQQGQTGDAFTNSTSWIEVSTPNCSNGALPLKRLYCISQ